MTRHYADAINEQLSHDARHGLRTARIDLDGFLALAPADRAARWRLWDLMSKQDAVIQMLNRRGETWDDAAVARWIAHYDEKWSAAEPAPIAAVVAAALERLADESAQHARAARQAGESDDARYFQRAATAYTNALIEWRRGVRPDRLPSGAWLLPSRRAGEPPHIVRLDGDYVCDCKAGASMHWPIALIIGLEVAHDDAERFDDAPEAGAPLTYDVITVERRAVGDELAGDPEPKPNTHEWYQWRVRRRREAGLDCCGLPLGERIARARRALRVA